MDESGAASMGIGGMLFMLVFIVLMVASLWKVFTKAGEPGWASIVPIYNTIVILKIAGKPWWWFILFMIPLVGIVMMIIAVIALAKNFGKGAGFALGLIFLPFIFFPILAFGDAKYLGDVASQA